MRRIIFGLTAAMLVLAACGSDADEATSAVAEDDGGDAGGGESTADGALRSDAAPVPSTTSSHAELDAAAPAGDEAGSTQREVGLRAGSVDDNESWEAYLRYREAFALLGIPFDDLPVDGRRIITVTDDAGLPVLDAVVRIRGGGADTTLRTGSDGRAVFLAPVGELDDQQSSPTFEATVTHGAATATQELGSEANQTIVLDGVEHDRAVRLDVLFLVDATGSMGDEIERLKANMVGVAEKIAESDADPDVRFGLTSYRDTTDDYVARTVDFTSDVGSFVESLRGLVADGGGDTPEALNEAFAQAVSEPRWRTDEDVIRLVFLIADAPPHIGRGTSYVDSIAAAAGSGIRVFPIASSGTDDQAEYVLRQIAQATLGRFVFLSYGADGAALGSESNIDDEAYDVLALDDLIVRLVEEQLAPLTGR
ncbi:vWA domain-containing protein [Actinospongicola halichondriae]|uniref:vWA domain-containing protein n=1 Tax=Actinospongicola halichondriae TaxID=3236844 RepID=UPI003D5B00A4